MIVDDSGQPVWFRPLQREEWDAMDFKVQRYKGEPLLSEFTKDGELLFSATFPPEVESYRAFRFPWSGQPDDHPAVAAESGPDDEVTLYAS